MEQNLKVIIYAMGAMILAPQTLYAQTVNVKGLDSLRSVSYTHLTLPTICSV